MRTSELEYELPDEQIARHPTTARDGARLLVTGRHGLEDSWVRNWPEMVPSGALVVVNDTKVRQARLIGRKRGTGGRVELLLLERLPSSPVGGPVEHWEALARPMRALHPGCWVDADEAQVLIGARIADGRVEVTLHVDPETSVETCLANIGRVPIPPYLGRDDELSDVSRYQTVFAERIGSVAAPTAGLHLTNAALARLASRGISVGKVTLHVGLGTFRPVSVDDLDAHPMHSEVFEVSETLASQVASTRAKGGVVVAVGTTVIRALESASDSNQRGYVRAQTGRTRLLIQPGYRFSVVDALLTNFHQPKSTLLALVAAAIGTSTMKEAYDHALRHGYRFLSYGDAMWIPECSR